mgnify:CR=1 FL=1
MAYNEEKAKELEQKTVTELEQGAEEFRQKYAHVMPAYAKRLMEQHADKSPKDLPNYDPEKDMLEPPQGYRNVFNPETGLIEDPDWLLQTQALLADFVEGLLLKRDVFDIDDVIDRPQWQETVTELVGEFGTSSGLLFLSSLITGLVFTELNTGLKSPQ